MMSNDSSNLTPHPAGLSASLVDRASRRGEAFEFKYVVNEATAQDIEARFQPTLAMDPHADPALGGSYAITSLYLDTPAFDVFFRVGRHAIRKYRVRRYGDSPSVYLERKSVKDRRVRKRREAAQLAELEESMMQASPEKACWFSRQASAKALLPVCRVKYLRRAMYGACPDGPMRVTFDRSIRGGTAHGWSLNARGPEVTLLDGLVVCEFKFVGAMPAPMKQVAAALALAPCGLSKYRACVRAFEAELAVPRRSQSSTPDQVDQGAPRA